MGVNRKSLSWVKSYLSARTRETKFSQLSSEICEVESGVPQGSILGPILFIAYTADLAEAIPESKIVAYADDAAILVSETRLKNLRTKIERTLENVQKWYTENGLLINPSKTRVYGYGQKHHGPNCERKWEGNNNRIQEASESAWCDYRLKIIMGEACKQHQDEDHQCNQTHQKNFKHPPLCR